MAVDITGLSTIVAEMLGTSEAMGGAFCTFILWISVTGFLGILLRESMTNNIFITESIFILGLGTLIGWLDYWWIIFLGSTLAILGGLKIGNSAG